MNKSRILVTVCCFVPLLLIGQYTAIPDPEFETFLISQGMDNVLDGQVLTTNIDDNTFLQINETAPFFNITDLTGIQDFISLELLIIGFTQCETIDLGNLPDLKIVSLSQNESLQSIEVRQCGSLEEFYAGSGTLISFDGSQNQQLKNVIVSGNNLLNIDLRNGNNQNIELFSSIGSPILSCVLVDDASFSQENWPNIINIELYTEDETTCEGLLTTSSVDHQSAIIYPNPVVDLFSLQSDIFVAHIALYDLSGKFIKTLDPREHTYDIAKLPSGIYLLRITTPIRKETIKLVKR